MKTIVITCIVVIVAATYYPFYEYDPYFYPFVEASAATISFSYDSTTLFFTSKQHTVISFNLSQDRYPSQAGIYGSLRLRHFNTQLDYLSYEIYDVFTPASYRSIHFRKDVGNKTYHNVTQIFDKKFFDLSPDDSTVILNSISKTGAQKIEIADANNFTKIQLTIQTTSSPTIAKFSLDGRYIFIHVSSNLMIYNSTTATLIHQINFDSSLIDIQFVPGNQIFVTITQNKILTFWNITDFTQAKQITNFDTCGDTQYSKDNKYFLYMDSAFLLSILDPTTFQVLQTIQGCACGFKMSPDKLFIALPKDSVWQIYSFR